MKANKYFKLFITAIIFILCINFNAFAAGTWSAQSFTSTEKPDIVNKGNTYILANGSIYMSNDGKAWASVFIPPTGGSYNEVRVLNNEFIAMGENVQAVKSSDGKDWTPIRLNENIELKDLYYIENAYIWINPQNQILYSENLLTWNEISMPNGETFKKAKIINNKCFISTSVNQYLTNYWVLDNNFIPIKLDSLINSIDTIAYLSEIDLYVYTAGTTINNKLYTLVSNDTITWERKETDLDVNSNFNILDVKISNSGNKLFLKIQNQVYVTSNLVSWFNVDYSSTVEDINYSGNYFYNNSTLKDIFISRAGANWHHFSLPNKMNVLSKMVILNNRLFILNVESEAGAFKTTVYSYIIDSLDNGIPDINSENTESEDKQPVQTSEQNSEQKLDTVQTETDNSNTKHIKIKLGTKQMETEDGSIIEIAQPLIIENGSALVPLKDIMVQIGASLSWKEDEQEITVYYKNKIIQLYLGSSQIKVNGKESSLPVPFKSIEGVSMVPIKPIADSIGISVEWLNDTDEILITYE